MKKKINDFDEERFFDLRSDVYFKSFFSDARMLAMFLSVLWKENVNPQDITYNNSESTSTSKKKITYDILASIKLHDNIKDIRLNLEMQNEHYAYLGSRMDYYSARSYSEALEAKENYSTAKSDSIWFLGFNNIKDYTDEKDVWYEEIYSRTSRGIILNKNKCIRLIFLKNKDKCSIIELEEFFKLFDNLKKNELPNFSNTFAKEATEMLKKLNKNDALRHEAFSRELFIKDHNSQMEEKLNEGIKIGEAKGMAEGLAKGEAKGIAEGLVKGEAKGKVENTIEVVKRMHLMRISNDIIAEATNTSLEEIEKIINE